ncbi:MAG: DUF3810 domain-containing protein, partial [Planctomycetota bacterium]
SPASSVERVYARGLFPPLRTGLTRLAGLCPVSLAELVLAALGTTFLVWLARALRDLARGRRRAVELGGALVRGALWSAGGAYLAFLLLWGFNHGREPYALSAGLEVRPSEPAELLAAAEELVARANELRAGLAEDEQGVFRARLDRDGLSAAVAAAYARAGNEEALLAGPTPLVRFALASPLLTSGGISGIYSPFTAEAHVNAAQPDAQLGFSACHEVAHARGFAREDEANYLAWRVGARAEEPELAYSATLGALRLVLAAMGGVDVSTRTALRAHLAPAVLRDLRAIDEFWSPSTRIAHTVRQVSNSINDTYLKSQGQAQGTHSYGRMVDLLLAARRARAVGTPR